LARRVANFGGRLRTTAQAARICQDGERKMLDAMMLAFGVGMFICFLAYTALCDKI
jgi:hypothetical protein